MRVVPFSHEKSPKANGSVAGSLAAKDPLDGAGLITIESLITVESWLYPLKTKTITPALILKTILLNIC